MEYNEYVQLQLSGSGFSFGSKWGDQMEEAILLYLQNADKSSKILDIGCGEGRGLLALRNIGFTNLCGIDISPEKIARLKSHNIEGYVLDFHNLDQIEAESYDYIFCSHAIEHSLKPDVVIANCLRISNKGLFIVPIDDSPQPEIGKSPHTHNFSTILSWTNLFDSICKCTRNHEVKERLGQEVWTTWIK